MENFEQQHAIPQQISAYEFRLVGDMTLKQFFQLAAGALVSLVLYATTLPAIVKWPLIIMSFLVGVAIAFFPLEGRSIEKWILLFARSIYSPTLYVWDRSKAVKSYFKPEDSSSQLPVNLPQVQDDDLQQQAQMAPVGQVEETKKSLKNLEKNEAEFLSSVSSHLSGDQPQGFVTKEYQESESSDIDMEIKDKEVQIPKAETIKVEKSESPTDLYTSTTTEETVESEVTPIAEDKVTDSQKAVFSQDSAPPVLPSSPNIIVGQVLDEKGSIIDAAILEIRDDLGRPTRAVKTNKLGHFQIVTPLVDGNYKILTEKDGYHFDNVEFEAKGEIIEPILIKGTKLIEQEK